MPRRVPGVAAPSGADLKLDRRALAFALSAAIHGGALALLLLWHFTPSPPAVPTAMTVMDLPDRVPPERLKPPPPPRPRESQGAAPAREAGAAGPKVAAAPIAVAIPIAPPSFVPAAIPDVGNAPSPGAATSGAGTGTGGAGSGSGGGGNGGNGAGGRRGEGTEPEIVRGDFKPSDYPKSLREAGPKGRTWTEVLVGINGRPISCQIERSSGTALLDSETCRIIMQRFRFRPGRDAAGKPVVASFFIDIGWEFVDLNRD